MKILTCQQRSPEWVAVRVGRLTSSRASDMLTTIKAGEAAARRNLRVRLVLERITGKAQESGYQSVAMEQGIAREADALLAYEAITGQIVRGVGFLAHDTLLAGTSPDGYVGEFEGVIEAKCPMAATHLEALQTGVIPLEYSRQILHHLWISGAQWCDWLSWHPDFPEPLQATLVRVVRSDTAIKEYDEKARAFLAEVDREVEAVLAMQNCRGASSSRRLMSPAIHSNREGGGERIVASPPLGC